MGFLYKFWIHNTCDSVMSNMLKKKTYVYFFQTASLSSTDKMITLINLLKFVTMHYNLP